MNKKPDLEDDSDIDKPFGYCFGDQSDFEYDESYDGKFFNIWSEGYAATGQSSDAQCMGSFPGKTFKEAVKNWMKTIDSANLVDLNNMTYWGCKLYPDESSARKTFG